MASGRAKASNYVHSNISGTQGLNTTQFCASTQVSSIKCGQPRKRSTVQGVRITRVLFPFDGKNISGRELGTLSFVRTRFNNQRVF